MTYPNATHYNPPETTRKMLVRAIQEVGTRVTIDGNPHKMSAVALDPKSLTQPYSVSLQPKNQQ